LSFTICGGNISLRLVWELPCMKNSKMIMKNKEDFYKKLKLSLENTTKFPTEYMFKFIIPNDEDKVTEIKGIFNYSGVIIDTKPSKTGKYKSLTIVVTMKDADEVIKKYKEVSGVEGVISL